MKVPNQTGYNVAQYCVNLSCTTVYVCITAVWNELALKSLSPSSSPRHRFGEYIPSEEAETTEPKLILKRSAREATAVEKVRFATPLQCLNADVLGSFPCYFGLHSVLLAAVQ